MELTLFIDMENTIENNKIQQTLDKNNFKYITLPFDQFTNHEISDNAPVLQLKLENESYAFCIGIEQITQWANLYGRREHI